MIKISFAVLRSDALEIVNTVFPILTVAIPDTRESTLLILFHVKLPSEDIFALLSPMPINLGASLP